MKRRGGLSRAVGRTDGDSQRRAAARSVNAIMTATYWEIGRRIVEVEQGGGGRAEYGQALLKRLAADLTTRFGRGFSRANLEYMRRFYLAWPISQTLSGESSGAETASLLSRNKAAMLAEGQQTKPEDAVSPEEEIKDPLRPGVSRSEGRVFRNQQGAGR